MGVWLLPMAILAWSSPSGARGPESVAVSSRRPSPSVRDTEEKARASKQPKHRDCDAKKRPFRREDLEVLPLRVLTWPLRAVAHVAAWPVREGLRVGRATGLSRRVAEALTGRDRLRPMFVWEGGMIGGLWFRGRSAGRVSGRAFVGHNGWYRAGLSGRGAIWRTISWTAEAGIDHAGGPSPARSWHEVVWLGGGPAPESPDFLDKGLGSVGIRARLGLVVFWVRGGLVWNRWTFDANPAPDPSAFPGGAHGWVSGRRVENLERVIEFFASVGKGANRLGGFSGFMDLKWRKSVAGRLHESLCGQVGLRWEGKVLSGRLESSLLGASCGRIGFDSVDERILLGGPFVGPGFEPGQLAGAGWVHLGFSWSWPIVGRVFLSAFSALDLLSDSWLRNLGRRGTILSSGLEAAYAWRGWGLYVRLGASRFGLLVAGGLGPLPERGAGFGAHPLVLGGVP